MGWGGPWSSILRRLVIPQDAQVTDPRVVIDSQDPLIALINDAGISYYWDDGRGFVTGVERSGDGPTAVGQWRLYGYADGVGLGLSQFIDVSYDPVSPENDGVVIWGGSRYTPDTATVSVIGNHVYVGARFTDFAVYVDYIAQEHRFYGDVYADNGNAWVFDTAPKPLVGTQPVASGQTGTETVSFAVAATSWTRSITFGTAFPSKPSCVANINNGSGSTASWNVRCFSISTTGFTLFGFGPSNTWSNVDVQWNAFQQ